MDKDVRCLTSWENTDIYKVECRCALLTFEEGVKQQHHCHCAGDLITFDQFNLFIFFIMLTVCVSVCLHVQVLHDRLPPAGLRVRGGADLPWVRGNLIRPPQLFSTGAAQWRVGSQPARRCRQSPAWEERESSENKVVYWINRKNESFTFLHTVSIQASNNAQRTYVDTHNAANMQLITVWLQICLFSVELKPAALNCQNTSCILKYKTKQILLMRRQKHIWVSEQSCWLTAITKTGLDMHLIGVLPGHSCWVMNARPFALHFYPAAVRMFVCVCICACKHLLWFSMFCTGVRNHIHHLPREDHWPLWHAPWKHLSLHLSSNRHNNDR